MHPEGSPRVHLQLVPTVFVHDATGPDPPEPRTGAPASAARHARGLTRRTRGVAVTVPTGCHQLVGLAQGYELLDLACRSARPANQTFETCWEADIKFCSNTTA